MTVNYTCVSIHASMPECICMCIYEYVRLSAWEHVTAWTVIKQPLEYQQQICHRVARILKINNDKNINKWDGMESCKHGSVIVRITSLLDKSRDYDKTAAEEHLKLMLGEVSTPGSSFCCFNIQILRKKRQQLRWIKWQIDRSIDRWTGRKISLIK